MRGPGLLILLAALVTATPALAQAPPAAENTRAACTDGHDNDGDGHVDCDDQDCQDFTFCAAQRPTAAGANDLATLRGRGTTRVVIGAVLLSLGLVVGGTSGLLWAGEHYGFDAGRTGAVVMDVGSVLFIGGGTALLAIGAGNLAEARRPRVALGPASLTVRF